MRDGVGKEGAAAGKQEINMGRKCNGKRAYRLYLAGDKDKVG